MKKHIGKFADVAALSAAVVQNAISRPFVALTEDNDKVVYGPKLDLAKVGDIAVYGVAEDQIYYIKQANYNTTDFPTADYVPIGVVCRNQRQDIVTFQNEDVRVMGLKWPNKNDPDNGAMSYDQGDTVLHYASEFTPYRAYSSLEDALSDMDGRANSQKVIEQITLPEDWKTMSTLTPSADRRYGYPYCLAWRYKTPGTEHGDWYIPAAGELRDVVEDSELFGLLNSSLVLVGGARYVKTSTLYLYMPLTSSWVKGNQVITGSSTLSVAGPQISGFSRAICSLAITELKK